MKIEVEWCKAASQHIRLISEGSCDTEAWSKDAENSAMIELHFKYLFYTGENKSSYKNLTDPKLSGEY